MDSFEDGALQETDTDVTISQDNWSVSFDKETGALVSFQSDGREMVAEGLLPNYWRAYTVTTRRSLWTRIGRRRTMMRL